MSITMAVPGQFVVTFDYRRDNGTAFSMKADVVAFDEHGGALVAGSQGLVPAGDYTGLRPKAWWMDSVARTVIPAHPGWMVDVWDEFGDVHSCPVVAWIHEPGNEIGEDDSKVLCVNPYNRDGNVGLEEVDITGRGAQVRMASADELEQLRRAPEADLAEEAPPA